MFNFLLAFLEGEEANNQWLSWVLIAGVMVLLVVLMIVPQRKQRKQHEQMMSKLVVGATVTTIGGVVGTVTEIDPATGHIVIETGVEGSTTTIKLVKNAIYMVNPENQPTPPAETESSPEDDEIK